MKSNIKCGLFFLLTVFAAFHLFRQLRPIEVAHAQATNGTPDTTPPTAPSSPAANVSTLPSLQTNLSWTPSTDNVAVTAYYVERCSGAGCSNFAQIGSSVPKTYSSNLPLTENPISQGGQWTNGLTNGLDWNDCRTNGTMVYGAATVNQSTTQFKDPLCIHNQTWRP